LQRIVLLDSNGTKIADSNMGQESSLLKSTDGDTSLLSIFNAEL